MLELLFALLELFLEILFEAAFEFAAAFVGELILRGAAALFDTSEFKNPLVAGIGYLFLGAVTGGLSLLVFPHPLVQPSRVPGVSVIISPVLVGLGMSFVGSTLRKRNQRAMQIETFGYGFAFALGMALVRFFFTTIASWTAGPGNAVIGKVRTGMGQRESSAGFLGQRKGPSWENPTWWNLLIAVPWFIGLVFLTYSAVSNHIVAKRQ